MALASHQSYKMFHRPSHEQDFTLYPDSTPRAGYASPIMDMSMSPGGYGFSRSPQEEYTSNPAYDHRPVHTDMNGFMLRGRTSPGLYPEDGELRMPPSNLSTASAPSAPSSTVGSPNSSHDQLGFIPDYPQSGMNVNPSIVGSGEYFAGTEYSAFTGPGMEDFTMTFDSKSTFVGESARISHAANYLSSFIYPVHILSYVTISIDCCFLLQLFPFSLRPSIGPSVPYKL